MSEDKSSLAERRSGRDRRKLFDVYYLTEKKEERRRVSERRSQQERRDEWKRVSKWASVPKNARKPEPEEEKS